MKKVFLLILICLSALHKSSAQVAISLTGNPIVTTGWVTGGFATAVDSEIRLTTAVGSESGYVYYNTAENVTACGQFQVDFDFKIVSSSSGVADGIAFFFENSLTTFTSGGGLGLPTGMTGMVLTMDTYDNDADGLNPEAELFGYTTATTYTETTSGTGFLGISGSHAYFSDGSWHHVKLTYNGGVVKVYLNGGTTASITGSYSITSSGYFGFTASTGGVYSTQYIKNVHINSNSISPIQGTTTICAGTTTTLTDSTTGGTWSSSAPSVASINTAGVVTSITGGTTTVTYAYGTSCSATTVLSVTPYPTAPAVTSPVYYCQGAPTTALTSPGTGLLWYTVATGGTGSATAPTPSSATVGTTNYYVSQTTGTCESSRANIAVNISVLTSPTASNNGPVCIGSSITVSSSAAPGDYYLWTGPGSFTATTQNFTFSPATVAESGTYCVRDSTTGCASAPVCTTIDIQSIPVITTIVPANPTACFGSDGTISLGAFTIGSTYTIHYTSIPGSVVHTVTAVANAAGNLIITGLSAGGYNSITVLSSAGCTSASSGLYILTNVPTPVITPSSSTNPTTCSGSNGTIILGGLTASITYTVSYTLATVVHTVSATANASGQVIITGLSSGVYSTVTVNPGGGCVSAAVGPFTLTDPPTPAITTSSSTNPATCISNDGTIILNGLTATTAYTVDYTLMGVTHTVTVTSSASGQVIVPALSSGTYSAVFVVSPAACSSASTGPFVLSDPGAPVISSTATTNPTTCLGTDGTITLNGLTAGVTYTTTYNIGATPYTVSLVATTSGQVVITGLASATYSSITVTNPSSCTAASVGPLTLTDPAAPVISSATGANPTICGGADGSITLSGLTAGAAYTTSYTSAGTPVTATITAGASGQVVITGLASGTYSTITVTNSLSCSAASAGPVTLTDPAAPVISSAASTNPTTCLGTDGTITLNGLTAGTAYTVNYLDAGTAATATITANTSGQVVITGLTSAAYTGISVTSPISCASNTVASIVLTDPAPPVAPTAGSNSSLCSGSTLLLTASGEPTTLIVTYSWSGPASFTSAVQNPSLASATSANAGVYSVTATHVGCISAAGTVTVVVNPTATITATFTSPSVCGGADGSIILSGGVSGTSYTVSYTHSGTTTTSTITANTSGQVIITGLAAGTYTALSISSSSCSSNSITSVALTDPSAPAIPVASVGTPVCQGGALNFTGTDATTGVTWSWTGPGFTSPSTLENPSIASATTADAGTYTLTVNLSGCSSSATVAVVVNPIPTTPTATSNSPVCSGSTIDLNATSSTGATFSWAGPGGYAASTTSTTETISPAIVPNTGTYTVTATLAGCAATAVATVAVVVNLTPGTPIVPAGASYCQFAPAAALTATGTGLLWYNTATGGTGSTIAPTPSTAVVGTVTYYVSQTSAAGCESPRAAIVTTISLKPAAPVVTASYGYCQYDVATVLTATGTALGWHGPGATAVYATAPTPATTSAATEVYYVTQTVAGCASDSAVITVSVSARPDAPVTANRDYCQNALTTTALTATGTSILWYTTATGGVGSAVAPIPSTTTAGTTTWYATQTVGGCESFRAPATVTVHSVPVFTIAPGKPYDCQYDTLSLQYSGAPYPGAEFNWSVPAYASYTVPVPGTAIVTFDTSSTDNIVSLTVGDGYAPCNVTKTYSVTVYNAPVANFYLKPDICSGDTIKVALTNHGPGIAAYHWNFDNATIVVTSSDSSGPYKVTWPSTGVYTVTLMTESSQNCPSRIITDTVDVHPYPNAQIAPVVLLDRKTGICTGDSVLLMPLHYEAGNYYSWAPQAFFNETNTRNVYGIINQPGYATLTVTDAYGCASSDSVLLDAQPCCMVTFPTAFTPNNDGLNDYFRPISYGHHDVHAFRIANRWGQTVFESGDMSGKWDGTFNGVPQDMGVYFYYFSFDCDGKQTELKGEVNLIR